MANKPITPFCKSLLAFARDGGEKDISEENWAFADAVMPCLEDHMRGNQVDERAIILLVAAILSTLKMSDIEAAQIASSALELRMKLAKQFDKGLSAVSAKNGDIT